MDSFNMLNPANPMSPLSPMSILDDDKPISQAARAGVSHAYNSDGSFLVVLIAVTISVLITIFILSRF